MAKLEMRENGLLGVNGPRPGTSYRLHNYRVNRVFQASIWDEAPNRVLVQGLSLEDGAKSIMELIINEDNPEQPITSSTF